MGVLEKKYFAFILFSMINIIVNQMNKIISDKSKCLQLSMCVNVPAIDFIWQISGLNVIKVNWIPQRFSVTMLWPHVFIGTCWTFSFVIVIFQLGCLLDFCFVLHFDLWLLLAHAMDTFFKLRLFVLQLIVSYFFRLFLICILIMLL